ncbi:high frequency lysogenization protein HflD [Psychrosphaera haliotis]|uniref:High frequency lysogenization protein HflD homolog n=1 Tax=Psychrosphaera haliotis TaxID=555083 RepID=A0A6N8F5L1_9GAMM|nr:high frequency lysogenization protein HflD [Psychrosphaera haliotis]MUH71845.1 high frequency lysogenization protein HflD [Psychrosphaera haliotis]
MSEQMRNQTIAMAALCEAALLIQQVSKGQAFDSQALATLVGGIMNTAPENVDQVYPNLASLKQGSYLLVHQLSGQATSKDVEVTRYLAGMMSLSKKLLNNQTALTGLSTSLKEVERRLEHFDITDASIIGNFADIYSKNISPIGQKIKVIGTPQNLKQPIIQNQVRALLLAGVRAAVLWRQMGGKRRQFIFSRNKILKSAISFNNELSSIS